MKRYIFILVCSVIALCSNAQEKSDLEVEYNYLLPSDVGYIEGEAPYMFDEAIKVTLDCSEAKYLPKKVKYDENGNKLEKPRIVGSSFKTFFAISKRDSDWEEKSLMSFCFPFNEEASSSGIVTCTDCEESKYKFVIKVMEIYKDGNIKVNMVLKDAKTDETLCVLDCVSHDGDVNDKITLRDQMKSIGATMGKAMKKIQKYNAKQRKG